MMNHHHGPQISEASQQRDAADRVVGGPAAGVAEYAACEVGAEEVLGDAARIEARH